MKGLLFHQQLEIRVEVEGEEFHQGETVNCSVSIKNRGTSETQVPGALLELAHGDGKLVKQKAENAFEVLAGLQEKDAFSLTPGEEKKFTWSFMLEKNCFVTDKAKSFYVLYGVQKATRAHLQLNVLPHADIEGIVLVFETSFQFLPKGFKSKSGWVQATLKPPVGRRFLTVEALELFFRFEEEKLILKYKFKVKKLEASATAMSIQKDQKELVQKLERSDYMSSAGFIDSKLLEPKIEEALSGVGNKLFS